MIALDVRLSDSAEKALNRMAAACPSMFVRAHGRAAAAAKRQIQSILNRQGRPDLGVPKFAKHSKLTVALHGRHKMFADAFNNPKIIVSYVGKNGGQVVGWPDRADEYMERLQEAKTFEFEPHVRQQFHRDGVQDVPRMYDRPARKVIDPYRAYLEGVWADWVKSNFKKLWEKRFGGEYVDNGAAVTGNEMATAMMQTLERQAARYTARKRAGKSVGKRDFASDYARAKGRR